MARADAGPEEQLRLTKMLGAFTRLVEVERKRIMLAYERLLALGQEIEHITDCLKDSDEALVDSITDLELANDRLVAALFGEPEIAEEETEETNGFAEIDVIDESEAGDDGEEVIEIDEVGADEEMAKIPAPVGP